MAEKPMSGKAYARAWLIGEVPSVNMGPGPMFPARADVLAVLREEPSLVQQFIKTNVDVVGLHETPILEKVENGYDVYITWQWKKTGIVHHDDLWNALDEYLTLVGLR